MASAPTLLKAFRWLFSLKCTIVLGIGIGLLLVYDVMFGHVSLANRINLGGQLGTDTAFASRPHFRDLFFSHKGNIAHKWLNYFDIYDEFFGEFVGRSPTVLEIGVFNGGSLQLWQRYFANARVFGIDINPNVCKMPPLGPNITTFCFNINDKELFNRNFGEQMVFDIIIDDASHTNEDIIGTFCNLFPRLRPGGVYHIEDTPTSYAPSRNGQLPPRVPGSAVQFFQGFIDYLHYFHRSKRTFENDVDLVKELSLDHLLGKNLPSQGLGSSGAYIVKWLRSVAFFDSVVVLRKLLAPKLKCSGENVVGQLDPSYAFIENAKRIHIFYNTSANEQQH